MAQTFRHLQVIDRIPWQQCIEGRHHYHRYAIIKARGCSEGMMMLACCALFVYKYFRTHCKVLGADNNYLYAETQSKLAKITKTKNTKELVNIIPLFPSLPLSLFLSCWHGFAAIKKRKKSEKKLENKIKIRGNFVKNYNILSV